MSIHENKFSKVMYNHVLKFLGNNNGSGSLGRGLSQSCFAKSKKDQQARGMFSIGGHFNNSHHYTDKSGLFFKTLF